MTETKAKEKVDLLNPPSPITRTLGDGQDYTFAAPSLGQVAKLQRLAFDDGFKDPAEFGKWVEELALEKIITIAWVRLIPNYPDITAEQVGELINSPALVEFCGQLVAEMSALWGM